MSVERVAHELTLRGGVARRRDLPVSKRALISAVRRGLIVSPSRGVYALAGADAALELARSVGGARSHRSAAAAYGWCFPGPIELTVRRGSRVSTGEHRRATVAWGALTAAERDAALTDPLRTVVDCLIRVGGGGALGIADAAVRSGLVDHEELPAAVAADHRAGVRAARALVHLVDGRAESPLESQLRFVAHSVKSVLLVPQVQLTGPGWSARVDLADRDLGIVAEADSFTWHGSRSALAKDARRYDLMAADGWRVLRFTYEAIVFEPDWVREQLNKAAAIQAAMVEAGVTPWRTTSVPNVDQR